MIPPILPYILHELHLSALTLAAIAAGLGVILLLLPRMNAAASNGVGEFFNAFGEGLMGAARVVLCIVGILTFIWIVLAVHTFLAFAILVLAVAAFVVSQ